MNKRENELCPAWKKPTGNFMSVALSEEHLEQFKKLKKGDRILFKVIDPNLKQKESSPDMYVEIFKSNK